MSQQPISALLWPAEAVVWENRRVVLAVPTAESSPRERTRLQVRRVVREALSRLFAVTPEQIELHCKPGRAPQLGAPLPEAGLSFAHEDGLSLVAIRLDGPVGVDVMHRRQIPNDWPALARDYFAPRSAAQLFALSPEDGKYAFALSWVSLEAQLKCLGLPLDEWRSEKSDQFNACHVAPVVLPDGWIGALAWR